MANEAGQGCADTGSQSTDDTVVSQGHPASQSGTCTRLAVYIPSTNENNISFAFFTASGNDLTTVAGTRQVFTTVTPVNGCNEWTSAEDDFTAFSVTAGQYLGCWTSGYMSWAGSGTSSIWRVTNSGDKTDVTGQTFALDPSATDSLTADITAGGGGVTIPVLMHHYQHNLGK